MDLLILLSVVWLLGLCITVLHEAGHIIVSGGTLQNLQIGIAHKFAIRIKFRNITIYPLLPVAGISAITLSKRPTLFRLVCFTLAGSAFGLLIAILCAGFGFYMLPFEAQTEIHQTGHLGFLIRAVIGGTAGIRETVATAFIASGIMYGVQQIGNLLPAPGFDGFQLLSILRNRR